MIQRLPVGLSMKNQIEELEVCYLLKDQNSEYTSELNWKSQLQYNIFSTRERDSELFRML